MASGSNVIDLNTPSPRTPNSGGSDRSFSRPRGFSEEIVYTGSRQLYQMTMIGNLKFIAPDQRYVTVASAIVYVKVGSPMTAWVPHNIPIGAAVAKSRAGVLTVKFAWQFPPSIGGQAIVARQPGFPAVPLQVDDTSHNISHNVGTQSLRWDPAYSNGTTTNGAIAIPNDHSLGPRDAGTRKQMIVAAWYAAFGHASIDGLHQVEDHM